MGNNVANIGTIGGAQQHQQRRPPDQRAAHLAQGPAHAEVRRVVEPLRDGPLLRGQQRPARVHRLRRRHVHRARAFADFLLDQVSSKGRGSLTDAWTHLQDRTALYVADDYKITDNLTLNLGLRWGYTSPLVEKDDRQANFALVNAEQQLAGQNGNSRALYEPYYNGWEPRLGAAYRAGDKWVFRGGYGITQYMEGTGANLRLPLNPPFFFESQADYDGPAVPARSPPASKGCRPSTGRRASCARGIRTCVRSSRSSGTCLPSTCSARARRSTSATSATSRPTW